MRGRLGQQGLVLQLTRSLAHSLSSTCRLLEINKHAQAAELFCDVQQFKPALDAYIRAGSWERAREIARTSAPQYRDYVEREYTSHLKSAGDADGMVAAGAVDTALDIFVQRGEWEKVFEVAAKEGGETLARYTFPYMEQTLEKGEHRWSVCDGVCSACPVPCVCYPPCVRSPLTPTLLLYLVFSVQAALWRL